MKSISLGFPMSTVSRNEASIGESRGDRRSLRRFRFSPLMSALLVMAVAMAALFASPAAAQTSPAFGCSPAMANDIVCENSKTGNPSSQWDVSTGDAGDPSIQGFATAISVPQGGTISFKVKTTATSYRMDIYRMGYYAGNGARLITSIQPSAKLPQNQPACETDSSTDLYDCGNWAVSGSWTVPTNATSGIYFVHLVRADTGGDSHMVFVVRNDSSTSDILFQTSDEAWEAYNDWGGSSGVLGGHTLYGGPGVGNWTYTDRAYKVSYNRPYDTRSFEAATWVFGNEYPMVRWLEMNGYDVTYFTHVDGIVNSSLITNHKIYLSTGHDEYWSGPLRTNVEAARDAGVNLAFFSGNEVFWKTRWENSIDGSSTAYRTLVCYKETFTETQTDPEDPPTWTGTWRDPTFSPPDDGGQPENNFTGTLFMVNGPGTDDTGISIKVPQADGKMRFWRNTTEASLAAGATATLPAGTLGYEWDVDPDNGFRPAGTFDLSTATYNLTVDYLLDNGVTYGGGTATHHMTLHRAASGALVFGAGTVQWTWGLDSHHDNDQGFSTPAASKDMQQATLNLLADMGVQPATMQSTLIAATKSTDTTPPTSVISSPTSGSNLKLGAQVTVSGTATDSGGGVVGGVEVSVNGGQTWHPASGRGSWTYAFTPNANGSINILSRAVDDSGNIETPGPGVTLTAGTVYSISGTISPTAAGNGATVQLTGASSATVTATASGTFTFNGLLPGQYSVAASQTGYTFSPVSAPVTITSTSVTGVNFTGSLASGGTYSISGSVNPATSGVTVTLSGSGTGSTLTDASGDFSLSGLANGTYTVTPSFPYSTFSPSASTVTVSGANITGVTFGITNASETLFTTQVPALTGQSDGVGVNYELGTLLQSDIAGQIVAIRFWKDSNETGTHTGNIWSASGTLLTSVVFTNETASGWQTQNLTTPLAIAAKTTYVASVNTGGTYYVETAGGLASTITNVDLSSIVGSDGVYASPGVFPTSSWENSNYFRDVVFVPTSVQTYSISGTISGVGGATVTLSANGATVATTTASGTGTFTFSSVASGTYTVTPTLSGYTFSPTSTQVPVSGASVTGVNFTATVIPTYNVSGTISGVGGATVTLRVSGTTVATTTAGGTGTYSFGNVANGTYTVTPTLTGYTFSPTNASVPVNGASVTGVNFTATAASYLTIAADANVSTNGTAAATTIKSPAFSTTAANELLLAFISTDGPTSGTNTTVKSIAGGSLTWTLVVRSNTQAGTAEIWRAFATAKLSSATVTATLSIKEMSSITVMSFTGVNTTGTNGSGAIGATKSANANPGAPSAALTTTLNGSLVIGVGNDWDNAIARTAGAGQTIVHQDLASVGDTYWVQMENSQTPSSGTSVTINDTAPTTDRYNLGICEIIAAP